MRSPQKYNLPKTILVYLLKVFAQATLWRYKPTVVGVTGSVGKSSTKEAIYSVVKNKFSSRRNIKNYNNEIGVPLTILGYETGGKSIFQWIKIFTFSLLGLVWQKNYPKVLVLEMGADRIGDISYLTSFIKPYVGVITAVGEIPVHVEFFQSANQVAKEKANLIKALDRSGWAVLNFDDERVRIMASRTQGHIFSYGFFEDADIKASNFEQHLEELSQAGVSFKVDYEGSNVPIRVRRMLAPHQVNSILAGIAVGIILKMNLVEISQNLNDYQAPVGRLNLIKGIKNSWIIDDTYNSSPSSSIAALEILKKMRGRKIAALGDMLELGAFTEEAHRKVGAMAAEVADIIFAIGARSIFMADEAKKHGFPEANVKYFASSEEAGRILQDMMREGDIVLIKGSQGIRMEKLVKEVMAEPERADKLLVRQEEAWQNK